MFKSLLLIMLTKDAECLLEGFSTGFRINYEGPRLPTSCKNLKLLIQNEDIAWDKVMEEVHLGRIAGPFSYRPISNLRCSPVCLIPEENRWISPHNTFIVPVGDGVNDLIDPVLASV